MYDAFKKIRKPIPKSGRPMTTKKGKKGYNRKKFKKEIYLLNRDNLIQLQKTLLKILLELSSYFSPFYF